MSAGAKVIQGGGGVKIVVKSGSGENKEREEAEEARGVGQLHPRRQPGTGGPQRASATSTTTAATTPMEQRADL